MLRVFLIRGCQVLGDRAQTGALTLVNKAFFFQISLNTLLTCYLLHLVALYKMCCTRDLTQVRIECRPISEPRGLGRAVAHDT